MEITNMDLIRQKLAAEGNLSFSSILKLILKDDESNPAKGMMRTGESYYRGEHEVLKHDFQKSQIYGEHGQITTARNRNNSNHHNMHNFYGLQVDQKAAYILGKPPTVTVEGAEDNAALKRFEDAITAISSDEKFADILGDYIVGASNKGLEWLHLYYDRDSVLQYAIVPAEEVIPFYDADHQEELTELIRYYSVAVIQNGEEKLRKKIAWWTKEDVTFYEETEDGEFILDTALNPNPRAHWYDVTHTDQVEVSRQPQSWGRVPFIPLYNNRIHASDVTRVKGLIDAYNLISSASTNNQIDLVELYWMIQGFGGEAAKEVRERLQINKVVSIPDPEGKIAAQQVTLNVQERIAWLALLRKDIYHLGQAVDTDADKFGNSPSGVSLQFQYTLLDQKADTLILKLKRAMKDFFWFITEDINRKGGTRYDSTLVRFDINKAKVINTLETAQMVQMLQGIVPDTTLYQLLPFIDDAAQAMDEMEAQKDANAKRQKDVFLNNDIPPDDEE